MGEKGWFKLIIGHSPRYYTISKVSTKQPSNITEAGDIKKTITKNNNQPFTKYALVLIIKRNLKNFIYIKI